MKVPKITGIIRRRILLNYRVEAEVGEALLPGNFRPKLVNGYAVAGVCLIRLEQIRPTGMPKLLGISSENSAHRIAVEWQDGSENKEGVFVPRRDTDSQLNALAGGRIFPGVHHLSDFEVSDRDGEISMQVIAKDYQEALVKLKASETDSEKMPENSIFTSLQEVSDFFEAGCVGYSSRPDTCKLDGLLLKTLQWQVSLLIIHSLSSSYFDDHSIFPPGSIEFDHALLMRDIPHEWHAEPEMMVEDKTFIKTG
ncbi:MAG: DUF2071 domain-containing protein [Verrucomicrobiota bacterium]